MSQMLTSKVYRDCDVRLRPRKVVVELWATDGEKTVLLDRTRMFGFLFFQARLSWRLSRMLARGQVMLKCAQSINISI